MQCHPLSKTAAIHPVALSLPAFCRFVERLPHSFDEGGTLLYDKRNVIRRFALADGTEFVVKRFKRPNFFQRIVYTWLRPTKSSRSYAHAVELLRRGVDTPQPLAYADFRRHGLVCDTFYICRACDWTPIRDLLNRPEQFDRDLARAFALYALRLHEKGVLHDDLNSTNTLFRREADGTFRFSVIDINRMRFAPPGHTPWKECKENITRFTNRTDLFRYVAETYAQARGLGTGAVDELLAQKRRHDRNRRRRKATLRALKSLLRRG